jgi:alpha-galactosidase
MTTGDEAVLYFRSAGVSLAIDVQPSLPRILHWGRDLGALDRNGLDALRDTGSSAILNNAPDVPRVFSIWPSEREGWSGTPAQSGHAGGRATTPRPILESYEHAFFGDATGGTATFTLADSVGGLRSIVRYHLDEAGILAVDVTMQRDVSLDPRSAGEPYALGGLLTFVPIPERADEIVDFTGKWIRERSPQRIPLAYGGHRRESRRGKPGHDSAFLSMVGTSGFGFRHGEIWAMHVAWSGNQQTVVERLPEGAGAHTAVLAGGELLSPGEILLGEADRYVAPTVLFAWSERGIDGIAGRFHERLRARPRHPLAPRPLVLNTWEAVYFDHDLPRLERLVDIAASVGVERVVLDDGWFEGRRGASAGLGDWYVDGRTWPNGLAPLVDRIRRHGMQFGLWFEPEMINLDSDLARKHPEWLLAPRGELGPSSRRQYVLDVANQGAYEYLLGRLDALVSEYSIDYIKWDHNRDLLEAVSRHDDGDRPGVHAQTLALYSMLDELRRRHPRLEIESCSGGGGRVDLGIIERTDRVWATDCNDPVERAEIEQWTSLLLPPELVGSHLGKQRSETTGRMTDLSARLAGSLLAHAGIEWDLTESSDQELEVIRRWSALYREVRSLVHSGTVVNADLTDKSTILRGVVAQDGSSALFTWTRLGSSAPGQSGRVRFPGLDVGAKYEIRTRNELGAARRNEHRDPEWLIAATAGWVALPGAVLGEAGVPLPTLSPQQAMVFEVRRTSTI